MTRSLHFFHKYGIPVLRILTDRGTEYCGKPETHDFELCLAINDIDDTKIKEKMLAIYDGDRLALTA